jgi:hypothetical protein
MFLTRAVRAARRIFLAPGAEEEEAMRKIIFALTAFSLLAGSAPALAAPCKDAKGKFIKCPTAKPKMCRNAKGHFAKCR